MKRRNLILTALLGGALCAAAATPLFERPRTYRQHKMLLLGMMQAVRSGNIEGMEEICRKAVELMPDDATWTYNLACALAYRAEKSEALDTLDRAIELGFTNAAAIEQDGDLKQLQGEPHFAALLSKARARQGQPIPGAPTLKPPTIVMGLPFEVNSTNTVWNMDVGCFQSFARLMRPAAESAAPDAYRGPAADLIRPWLSEGKAAGNGGDLYMNRDRGHSQPGYQDFPLLTPVLFSREAVDAGVDHNLPNILFEYPLVGNCSMAMTQGPLWRSLPRAAMTDQFAAIQQSQLYLSNQLWVYPEHNDHDLDKGDLFPANVPFLTVVQGSSFRDKPFVRAYAAALAALQPDTKRMLVQGKLLAPTLQMLLRYSSNRMTQPGDYLSGRAHPVVFAEEDLNVTNLVRMAHSLRPEEVVPPVALQVLSEDQARSGVDYFDRVPEALFNTPVCIARVVRGRALSRSMTLRAQAPVKGKAEFAWVLLQGDPAKVKIRELDADGSRVEITAQWHGWYRPQDADGTPAKLMSGRVDIGCFLKGAKYHSAPSILSLYYLPSEQRLYSEGRVVSIDYSNPEKRYSDPLLSVIKPWKDLFDYTDDGRLKGWYRRLGDRSDRYTYAGHKVLETDRLDRPLRACAVDYLPRESGDGRTLPVMVAADRSDAFLYTYKDDRDLIGTFAPAP
jgi:hypothetical protein